MFSSAKDGKTAAVVDSGSSYILMPELYFWEFKKQIKAASS